LYQLAGPTNPSYIPPSAFQPQVVPGASGGNTFGIQPAFGSQNAPPPNMQSYTSQVILGFDISSYIYKYIIII